MDRILNTSSSFECRFSGMSPRYPPFQNGNGRYCSLFHTEGPRRALLGPCPRVLTHFAKTATKWGIRRPFLFSHLIVMVTLVVCTLVNPVALMSEMAS